MPFAARDPLERSRYLPEMQNGFKVGIIFRKEASRFQSMVLSMGIHDDGCRQVSYVENKGKNLVKKIEDYMLCCELRSKG